MSGRAILVAAPIFRVGDPWVGPMHVLGDFHPAGVRVLQLVHPSRTCTNCGFHNFHFLNKSFLASGFFERLAKIVQQPF